MSRDDIILNMKIWKDRRDKLKEGIYAYNVNYSRFPPWKNNNGIPVFKEKKNDLTPTLVDPENILYNRSIDELNVDPFKPTLPFYYYSSSHNWKYWGWFLSSRGPDGDQDIDPIKDYIPGSVQSYQKIVSLTYDPTNGLLSSGDLWDSHELMMYKSKDYNTDNLSFYEFIRTIQEHFGIGVKTP